MSAMAGAGLVQGAEAAPRSFRRVSMAGKDWAAWAILCCLPRLLTRTWIRREVAWVGTCGHMGYQDSRKRLHPFFHNVRTHQQFSQCWTKVFLNCECSALAFSLFSHIYHNYNSFLVIMRVNSFKLDRKFTKWLVSFWLLSLSHNQLGGTFEDFKLLKKKIASELSINSTDWINTIFLCWFERKKKAILCCDWCFYDANLTKVK